MTERSYLLPGSSSPYSVSLNQTDKVNLYKPGFKEHIVSHKTRGNMGRTLWTKYTDVVVSWACSSITPPSSTKKLASAIWTPISYIFYPFSVWPHSTMDSASSKSLAVSGSIVKIVSFLKSDLFLISYADILYSPEASVDFKNFYNPFCTVYSSYYLSYTPLFIRSAEVSVYIVPISPYSLSILQFGYSSVSFHSINSAKKYFSFIFFKFYLLIP